MLFAQLKHYLELYITDSALKVSRSFYCFTTVCHGVQNCFPRLWGTGISDAILIKYASKSTKYEIKVYKFFKVKSNYLSPPPPPPSCKVCHYRPFPHRPFCSCPPFYPTALKGCRGIVKIASHPRALIWMNMEYNRLNIKYTPMNLKNKFHRDFIGT